MLPWPVILGMLASLQAYNGLLSAQAVSAAASAAGTAGLATGAATAAVASNPRGALWLIQQPLRLVNAPFYYLLGGAEANRRLKTLELANATLQDTQKTFLEEISKKQLIFDALKVCLSEDYIKSIKTGLTAGGGAIQPTNPAVPSLCSVGKFTDPFNETYTVVILNELGDRILVGICLVAAVGSGLFLIIYIFRRVVRYGLKGYRVAKRIILEEKTKENKSLQLSEPQNPRSNYLTS